MNDNFNRVAYKEQAKTVLRHSYWMPFLVCLLASVFGVFGGGGGSSPGSSGSGNSDSGANMSTEGWLIVIGIVVAVLIFSFCIATAVYCFVTYPVTVGMYRYFMKHRNMNQTSRFSDLFSVFRKNQYMKVVKVMFWYYIRLILWTLLFIIPGLIKAYEYFFVPYILAENPDIGMERAFEISKNMSDGHKWDIFVVGLSFLGWTILGALCCFVGVYFVYPYMQATYAEMYAERRNYALLNGMATEQELCGF